MIVIINYGMGNLRSISNKFRKLDIPAIVSSDIDTIKKADKLILPGVGHFRTGMTHLNEMGAISILNDMVIKNKVPILGICLGVQLFTSFSEEGNLKGLNWIDATTIRFKVSDKITYKVPHMGWNTVEFENRNRLDEHLDYNDSFYFVHSYHLKCNDKSVVWMKTVYDYEFVSAIRMDNIYGTQFHPEKSHEAGMFIIKNFAEV